MGREIDLIQELIIRNYALIDQMKVEFVPGLNVLTGETGAGKSIVVGAMSLVLGERSSADSVKSGSSNATVQVAIDISDNLRLKALISELGLESEDDLELLILERQISSTGKSKCHVNGKLTTLSTLKEIGDLLVDIHGQNEHQSLFRVEKHLDLLDSFGKLTPLRQKVSERYAKIESLQKELEHLQFDYKERLRQRELFEFQLDELQKASLKVGEDMELIDERKVINNIEELHEVSTSSYQKLSGSENSTFSLLDVLRQVSLDLSKLKQVDKNLSNLAFRLESVLYELEDISNSIREYADAIDFEPNRLEEIEARLDLIHNLKRKYGGSIVEIIKYKEKINGDLESLSFSSEKIKEVKLQLDKELEEAQGMAFGLSSERQKVAKRLESALEGELGTLSMPKTRFKVLTSQRESPSGVIKSGSKRYDLTESGIDQVEFLISPNLGEPLKPLAKVASGGEISRIMLALKSVLASSDEVSTLIFDEIDAGIGGHTAEVVGQKLKEISKLHQVVCITHLPQIASLAEAHHLISKGVVGDKTKVDTKLLDERGRVEELARMLGGKRLTPTALKHAKELIRASGS